jgi:hypothetical protein
MTRPTEDLKQVTKFVLYGWGYPALFAQPNGDRFQNRLVTFPANAAPVIAGANQEALSQVQSKLKIVQRRYRRFLRQQSTPPNPVWVWVDTPHQLTFQEMLAYREQFADWVEQTGANQSWSDRLLNSDLLANFTTQWHIQSWKRKVMALVVLTALTFAVMYVQY